MTVRLDKYYKGGILVSLLCWEHRLYITGRTTKANRIMKIIKKRCGNRDLNPLIIKAQKLEICKINNEKHMKRMYFMLYKGI